MDGALPFLTALSDAPWHALRDRAARSSSRRGRLVIVPVIFFLTQFTAPVFAQVSVA